MDDTSYEATDTSTDDASLEASRAKKDRRLGSGRSVVRGRLAAGTAHAGAGTDIDAEFV